MDIDSPVQPDLVTRLGYLCLGSRLKRLGERMQGSVAQLLAERGEAVQPAQLPILYALAREGAMTVGQIGAHVGISQPGVSRVAATLDAMGLIEQAPDPRDRRQRALMLTKAGHTLIDRLETTFFPAVRESVAQACAGTDTDFLDQLARIEAALEARPLAERIAAQLAGAAHG
jgi:DNA-binding MarR family transcriptional regulator